MVFFFLVLPMFRGLTKVFLVVGGWEYFNSLPGNENQPYLWAKIMKDAMRQTKEKIIARENKETESETEGRVKSRMFRGLDAA